MSSRLYPVSGNLVLSLLPIVTILHLSHGKGETTIHASKYFNEILLPGHIQNDINKVH